MARRKKGGFIGFQDIPQQVDIMINNFDEPSKLSNQLQFYNMAGLQKSNQTMDDLNDLFNQRNDAHTDNQREVLSQRIRQQTIQYIQEISNDSMQSLDAKVKYKTITNNIQNITEQQIVDLSVSDVNNDIETIANGDEIVAENLVEALENIDDFDALDLEEIEVIGRRIFLRNVVGNTILSMLVTDLNNRTDGGYISRKTSITTINNVNKYLERFSDLSLTKNTYTLRPKDNETVRKGTRILISIDEARYRNGNNVTIYIQMGRDKFVKEFVLNKESIPWLSKYIVDFFTNTFEFSKQKLVLHDTENDGQKRLIDAMYTVVKTGQLLVSPRSNDVGNLIGFKIKNKGSSNHWLILNVSLTPENEFRIKATSTIDKRFSQFFEPNLPEINSENVHTLVDLFDKDNDKWSNIIDENSFDFMLSKLTYRDLKQALASLSNETETDIKIVTTLSKTEVLEMLNNSGKSRFDSYDAESIVGKKDGFDYFILSQVNSAKVGDNNYVKFQLEYQKTGGVKQYINGLEWQLMLTESGILND